jgi:hypothetical protein
VVRVEQPAANSGTAVRPTRKVSSFLLASIVAREPLFPAGKKLLAVDPTHWEGQLRDGTSYLEPWRCLRLLEGPEVQFKW